jgi:hypothetical protein
MVMEFTDNRLDEADDSYCGTKRPESFLSDSKTAFQRFFCLEADLKNG